MISQRAAFARSQRVLYSHKQASLMLLLLERQCALYRHPIPSFHFPPHFLLVRGPHPSALLSRNPCEAERATRTLSSKRGGDGTCSSARKRLSKALPSQLIRGEIGSRCGVRTDEGWPPLEQDFH